MVEHARRQPRLMIRLGRFWALALACAVAGPGLARAQAPAAVGDPEAVILDELVVRARTSGPAWWRVTRGEGAVWILGVPQGLPRGLAWDDRAAKARLAGARALILPPQAHIGPFKAIGFFLRHRKALRGSEPLDQALPAQLAARFAAARESIGKPAGRYRGWRPIVAGVMLDGDFRKAARLEQDQPLDHLRDLAHAARVRDRRAASYDGGAVLNVLLDLPAGAEDDCLEDSLAEVEAGAARLRSAAAGWAHGDVRAALTAERGYERCLAALPAVSALITRGQADMTRAIEAALGQGGTTVAAVELRSLLARGGVIARLRADGFDVSTPDSAD